MHLGSSEQSGKKSCIMCLFSPEDILVLACNHTVCLECAFHSLANKKATHQSEVELVCGWCHEVTLFERELIKQIESKIRLTKQTVFPQIESKSDTKYQDCKYVGSFLQRMKRQYLPDSSYVSSRERKQQIFQFSSKEFAKQKIPFEIQSHPKIKYQNQNQIPFISQLYKTSIPKQNLIPSFFPDNQQKYKCKIHQYYDLLYFCINCQEAVCSQCLLRGKHQSHENRSKIQIIQNELPEFISWASKQLSFQLHELQFHKNKPSELFSDKIQSVCDIKNQTFQFFNQLKTIIQEQQKRFLSGIDSLLENLRKKQKQYSSKLKKIEASLSQNVQKVKQLRDCYQNLLQKPSDSKYSSNQLFNYLTECRTVLTNYLETKQKPSLISEVVSEQIESIFTDLQLSINNNLEKSIQLIRSSVVPFLIGERHSNKKVNSSALTEIKIKPTTNHDNSMSLSDPYQYISYLSVQDTATNSIQRSNHSVSISPFKGQQTRSKFLQIKKVQTKSINKKKQIDLKQNIPNSSNQKYPSSKSQQSEAFYSQSFLQKKLGTAQKSQEKNVSNSRFQNDSFSKRKSQIQIIKSSRT